MSTETALQKINEIFQEKNVEIINFKDSDFSEEELDDSLNRICGSMIGESAVGFLDKDEPDLISYLGINKENKEIIGIFIGFIEDNQLESSYTCSALKGVGELLRYYALLNTHRANPLIETMVGFAVGGIPAITEEDTKKETMDKKARLIDYHEKRGAKIDKTDPNNIKFEYDVNNIIQKFTKSGGRKRKTRRLKSKKRRRKGRKSKGRKSKGRKSRGRR